MKAVDVTKRRIAAIERQLKATPDQCFTEIEDTLQKWVRTLRDIEYTERSWNREDSQRSS